MTTSLYFSTPIYKSFVSEQNFNIIQKDFYDAYNVYKRVDRFSNPENFLNTHLVSTFNFNDSLFNEFKCDTFLKELDFHINNYLKDVNSHIINNAEYKITTSWIAWNPPQSYTAVHDHSDTDIAGCYYLEATGEEGNIFFLNPNRMLVNSFCFSKTEDGRMFEPRTGMLLLFPGWLLHGVHRNITDKDRISISFNIKFKDIDRGN